MGLLFGIVRIGAKVYLQRPEAMSLSQWAGGSLFGLLFLPSPVTPYYSPFNGAAWSLYLELAINLLYAAVLVRARTSVLYLILAVSAAVLVWAALTVGHLDVGYGWAGIHLGLARVGFSFTLGVLFARRHSQSRTSNTASFALIALLTAGMLVSLSGLSRAVFDLVAVLFLSPLLVWTGATFEPTETFKKPLLWLGE
ncbi:MAG: hypothetical protein JWP52_4511, partial [Rhizobacter sp.]|nr:hypothetical protein [Rhizobacter sp.]